MAVVVTPFIIVALFFGAILWFSVKAKPIGVEPKQKPYRWATYIALTRGIVSLGFLASVYKAIANGRIVGGVLIAILATLCLLTCVLLLKRKRLAIPVFFVT